MDSRLLRAALVVAGVCGCAQVLGIEELRLDERSDGGPTDGGRSDGRTDPVDQGPQRPDFGAPPPECGCAEPPCPCIGCQDEVCFGEPDGSFACELALHMEIDYEAFLPAGDFDGDGADDVLFRANAGGPGCIWYGRSGGRDGFDALGVSVPAATLPAVGDFDDDDSEDVFLYDPTSNTHAILFGRPSGGFGEFPITIPGSHVPAIGDFDADGRSDIFWTGSDAASMDVVTFAGTTRGSFVQLPLDIDGVFRPSVGDFDGDGHDDVALYAPGPATDHLFLGRDQEGFRVERDAFQISGDVIHVVADLNGDGDDDLFQYGIGDTPSSFIRRSAVTRIGPVLAGELRTDFNIFLIRTGDFDGDPLDGRHSVLFYDGAASVLVHVDDAEFSSIRMEPVALPGDGFPTVGDFDGDGRDDILLVRRTSP